MLGAEPSRPNRLVEYFITCGISQDSTPIPRDDRFPITDVQVVTDKHVPEDKWEVMRYTVSGNIASMTGTGLFSTKLFLCVERDPDKAPLTDVAIIFGQETTPMGFFKLDVNLNKGGLGKDIFLCFSRGYVTSKPRNVVVDLVVIQPKSNENCPADYMLVNKNLNAGSFRNPMYLCVKKISENPLDMLYRPVVLDRYPFEDAEGSGSTFPQMLPLFCYPQGADVYLGDNPPLPKCTTFVLTMVSGLKLYGVCINFHEIFKKENFANSPTASNHPEEQGMQNHEEAEEGTEMLEKAIQKALADDVRVWLPKTVCLVSHWPFYNTFMRYLVELWRMTLGSSPLPTERFLSNLFETPLPQNSRVNVQLSIGTTKIIFDRPPPDTFPLADYGMDSVFRCLSVENILKVLAALLSERKVLLVSSHSTLLTPVCEALLSFLFPFQWMHAYVPVLPTAVLGLDILAAPMPVFVGITATFVDPKVLAAGKIVFVNLDENTVRVFGDAVPAIPQQFCRTLLSELDTQAHVKCIPRLSRDRKETKKIGSEFLFTQLPAMDSPKEKFNPIAARACFLHLMVSLLAERRHRKCLRFPHVSASTTQKEFGVDDVFDRKQFIELFPRNAQNFARHLSTTQAFARLSEEKTIVSSDRQSELDFFDQCCNYESKIVNTPIKRGQRRGVTLVQFLSSYNQKSLVYEVPPPLDKDLSKKQFTFPNGFPFLSPPLFYSPRPVDQKYMRDVNSERRAQVLGDFKSAFQKSKSWVQKRTSTERKYRVPNLATWRAHILSAWFNIQVLRLTKGRRMWSQDEALKEEVDKVFKLFETIKKHLHHKNGKKAIKGSEQVYHSLLALCGAHNRSEKASAIFTEMKKRGIETTGVTYAAYINAIASRRSTLRPSKMSTIDGRMTRRSVATISKMSLEVKSNQNLPEVEGRRSYAGHHRTDSAQDMRVRSLENASRLSTSATNFGVRSRRTQTMPNKRKWRSHRSFRSRTKSHRRASILPQKFSLRVTKEDTSRKSQSVVSRSLGSRPTALVRESKNPFLLSAQQKEKKCLRNRKVISWSSVKIGVGAGIIPGYGEGRDHEYGISSSQTKGGRSKTQKLVRTRSPDPQSKSFAERKHDEQDLIRKLCSLSTSEIMAGWSLHDKRFMASSVRNRSLSFVPRIVARYSTLPLSLERLSLDKLMNSNSPPPEPPPWNPGKKPVPTPSPPQPNGMLRPVRKKSSTSSRSSPPGVSGLATLLEGQKGIPADDSKNSSTVESEQKHLVCVPFLAPRELATEVKNAVSLCPEDFFEPDIFRERHALLFWNMFWYVHALKLPYSFLMDEDDTLNIEISPFESSLWLNKMILPPSTEKKTKKSENVKKEIENEKKETEPSAKLKNIEEKEMKIGLEKVTEEEEFEKKSEETEKETKNDLKADVKAEDTMLNLPAPGTPPPQSPESQPEFLSPVSPLPPSGPPPATARVSQLSPRKLQQSKSVSENIHKNRVNKPTRHKTAMSAFSTLNKMNATLETRVNRELSCSAAQRRSSIIQMKNRVMSLSVEERKEAEQTAEAARQKLGKLYLGIVRALKRKKTGGSNGKLHRGENVCFFSGISLHLPSFRSI